MKHKKGILIKPRLTHSDIAALAGVVRETVTKIYNDLQDRGIITFEKRQLIIRDLERLKNEANLYI
jgi:CRP/FNR family cyclic AMP-dependent transcriptional regulator